MRLVSALALIAVVAATTPALAQSNELSGVLGNLSWGASPSELLEDRRAQIMDDYRVAIRGLRDPIEIDRHRGLADDRYEEVADSLETFPDLRTGYEVSVIRGEIAGERGQSLVTVREDLTTLYYVFTDERLTKLMVVYRLEDLDWVGFEGFVERLEQLFGSPDESEYAEDDIGRRMLEHVAWTDGETTLRVVDRSQMFSSYLLVYADATVEDIRVDVDELTEVTRPTSGRDVGAMMRRLQSDQTDEEVSADVVDDILGERTEVELRIRDEDTVDPAAMQDGEDDSALDEDEDLETVERLERPSRTAPSSDDDGQAEDEGEDDALIIY